MYSIKAITSLTGLTAETLRAWERRYQGILPDRSENGRRQYSQNDLEKLCLLAELTRNGHSISKIIGFDREQLRQLKSHATRTDISSSLLDQVVDALLNYRIDRCEQLLKRALLAYEPLDYAQEVLLPALKTIGDLWHEGRLSVAQEHWFSGCLKRILLGMLNTLNTHSEQEPAMLFATPSKEPHEFGILLCCMLAAAQNYRCYYLGADLPGEDIVEAIEHLQPDIVVIGLTQDPPETATLHQLRYIGDRLSMISCQLWLGGLGAIECSRQLTGLEMELLGGIDHFQAKAQHWRQLRHR